jgi:hypothetical protein
LTQRPGDLDLPGDFVAGGSLALDLRVRDSPEQEMTPMDRSSRTRVRLEEDGALVLKNLPFPPGTRVEVTVRAADESAQAGEAPHGTANPDEMTEPVMEHEWDVLE